MRLFAKVKGVGNTEEFRCLSLCTGYAGIELGLRRAVRNLRTVAYVEVEAFACANLAAKIEANLLDAAPVWTDIKTFDAEPFRDRVHIITAGYPCQGESYAGKRLGTEDPRWLWPHIERIIKAVRPVWFFGENVPGHLTLGFPIVYRSLQNLGYKVEAGLFTAAECGAPHRRERLFILANRTDCGCETMRIQQEGESTFRQSRRSLADTECSGSRQGTFKKPSTGIRGDRSAIGGLADTTAQRIQRPEPERTTQAGRQINEQSIKWPARPGQPQHEWEEPRVVAESNKRRHRRHRSQAEQNSNKQKNRISQSNNKYSQGQAQSRLGRAVDGPSCRVDRLRLLGNGVVPQQAEKAFRELMGLFE